MFSDGRTRQLARHSSWPKRPCRFHRPVLPCSCLGEKEELEWFKERGVIVRVLNVPTTLVEFPKGQEWVLEMVNNVLIEVMGTIAEQEWVKIKERREAGIAAMPIGEDGRKVSSRTGRGFGRPSTDVEVVLLDGETIAQACERLGISRATFYRKNSCRA